MAREMEQAFEWQGNDEKFGQVHELTDGVESGLLR